MNKEERKKILLTLPIEILVDLVIVGDEIEERNAKAVEYIKTCNDDVNLYSDFLDESYISNYGAVELLQILKGEE